MKRGHLIALGILLSSGLLASTAAAQSETAPRPSHRGAVEVSIDHGLSLGFGRVAASTSPEDRARRTGLGVTLDVAYRMTPRWSVGVESQYLELSNGREATSRGVSGNVGTTFHLNPYGLGDPFVRFGSGYRLFWENHPGDVAIFRHGFQVASAKLGYDIRAAESFAAAPIFGVDLDVFVWEDAPRGVTASPGIGTFLYMGLQGRFDIGGRREVPPGS